LDIPERFLVHETQYWSLNHHLDSALPGYLMLGSRVTAAHDLSELSEGALLSLGPLLANAQKALHALLKPNRVYIGRYGHTPGYPIHFHLIPIYQWVEALFWRDARYRKLEEFAEPSAEPATDGAELTFFVWREFCERPDPPPIEGPSVLEAIAMLRAGMRYLSSPSGMEASPSPPQTLG
jgi:diadenosine tetraphosphate (Ap4A) HIT family hydrolase